MKQVEWGHHKVASLLNARVAAVGNGGGASRAGFKCASGYSMTVSGASIRFAPLLHAQGSALMVRAGTIHGWVGFPVVMMPVHQLTAAYR